jgi:hypothetical protein
MKNPATMRPEFSADLSSQLLKEGSPFMLRAAKHSELFSAALLIPAHGQ